MTCAEEAPPPLRARGKAGWGPKLNKRRGLHKIGKRSVQAAIAYQGYLSDVEVRLHNARPHARPRPAKPPRHYPGAATTHASAAPPLPPTISRQHPPDRRPGNRKPGGWRTHREPRSQQPPNPRPPRHPRPHQRRHRHTPTATQSTPAGPPRKIEEKKKAKQASEKRGAGERQR